MISKSKLLLFLNIIICNGQNFFKYSFIYFFEINKSGTFLTPATRNRKKSVVVKGTENRLIDYRQLNHCPVFLFPKSGEYFLFYSKRRKLKMRHFLSF